VLRISGSGGLRALAATLLLLAGLGFGAALAAEDRSFDDAQIETIEGVIRSYIRNNPEVIIDALRAYDQEQKRLASVAARQRMADRRQELERDAGDFVGGNPDGDISLIEFFDYRCPYCKRVLPQMVELRKSDKKLRIVYKEFPILGPDSVIASRAAIASRAQGKYQAFHDAMMASRGKLTEAAVLQIAAEVGLDVERLLNDMQAPEVGDIIARNFSLAQALGITGTPSFVIGDNLVRGAVNGAELKRRIAEARSNCETC
jgi:protein-disulfide isomerase